MSNKAIHLPPEVYEYFHKISLREPELLKQLREETKELDSDTIHITPEQGQFMAMLVELLGAKKTLDIGTFTGYSALVVALAMPKDGIVVSCDTNKEHAAIGQRYWAMAEVTYKIDLHIGPALETLHYLISKGGAGTFDLSFIDADKLHYAEYYDASLALVRSGVSLSWIMCC